MMRMLLGKKKIYDYISIGIILKHLFANELLILGIGIIANIL